MLNQILILSGMISLILCISTFVETVNFNEIKTRVAGYKIVRYFILIARL